MSEHAWELHWGVTFRDGETEAQEVKAMVTGVSMPGQHQNPLLLGALPCLPSSFFNLVSLFLKNGRTFLSVRWDFSSRNTSPFPGGPLTEAIKLCVEVHLGMAMQDISAVLMEKSMATVCHTREATSTYWVIPGS